MELKEKSNGGGWTWRVGGVRVYVQLGSVEEGRTWAFHDASFSCPVR